MRKRIQIYGRVWAYLVIICGGFLAFEFFSPVTLPSLYEEILLQQANERILAIRRGTITLDFGVANAGKTVYINQHSHAFFFGAGAYHYNTYQNETLDQLFTEKFSTLMNYGSLLFSWDYYEPYPNVYPHIAKLHNITNWLSSFNATAYGVPLAWFYDVPSWVSRDNLTNATLTRIQRVIEEFPEINIWCLANELLHKPDTWFTGMSGVQIWEMLLQYARVIRPECTYILNDYDTVGPGDPAFTVGTTTNRFYQLVDQIVRDGFPPDALGFQFHSSFEWHPLQDIIDTFEGFGRFRIPIHITEFIPVSKGIYSTGTRKGPITETSQAEWAVRAYTMLFSHPAISCISWVDFAKTRSGVWLPHNNGYMMDESGRLLPVYTALYDLIHRQWNSTTTTTLDGEGKVVFTGFYGNYTASVMDGPEIAFSIVDNRAVNERPWRIADIQ